MGSDHGGPPEEQLIDSMLLAIDENEVTREVGGQGTCVHGRKTYVVGPWDRRLCARILAAWAREGWVGLYDQDWGRTGRADPPPAWAFSADDADTLRPEVAARILADPSAWAAHTWKGELCLFETPAAPNDDDDYRRVARAALEPAVEPDHGYSRETHSP